MNELSLDSFRKWMAAQKGPEKKDKDRVSGLIGLEVESKIPAKRLAKKINTYNGDLRDISLDFEENGGTIREIDGREFLIETSSGTFIIQRCFVKKR
jgi:hypothetical protein